MNVAFTYAPQIVAQLIYATILFALALVSGRAPMTARSRSFLFALSLAASALPIALLSTFLARVPIAIPPLLGAASFGMTSGTPALHAFLLADAAAIAGILIPIALVVVSIARTIAFTRRVMNTAAPPSQREQSALAAVSPRALSLVRSPEAPTAILIGILRPTIVLPGAGCDGLSDAELRSLLAHECAHAARRDNAFGVLERIVGAIYWFHPLMWILRRHLSLSREEACDEIAADLDCCDSVVSAITAMTHSFVVAPGASCASSANLRERIDYIMRYDSLRRSSLSHRVVAFGALMLIGTVAFTVGATTGTDATPHSSKYSGEKISLDLKDADLREVLAVFAKLTKVEFAIESDVQGKVTIAVRDTPWDEALDRIVAGNGYHWTLEAGKMHIHK